MRKFVLDVVVLLVPLLLFLLPSFLFAQPSNPSIIPVVVAPSGACTSGLPNQQVISTGVQYSCQNGTWAILGGGGGGGPYLPLAGGTMTGPVTAPAFYPQSLTAGPYASFFDDFLTYVNVAAANIGSPTSPSCASTNTVQDINHPGNIRVNSGTGGAGTGEACYASSNAGAPTLTSLNLSPAWTWESAVYVPVLPGTTAGSYQAGTATTVSVTPWTTGMGFYLSSANGAANDWYCEYGSTYTDSTIAATVAWTRLTMKQDGAKLHWYINGVEVCGTGVAIASLPSGAQFPFAFTASGGTAANAFLYADYALFQRQVTR